jgi:hypothetical protein
MAAACRCGERVQTNYHILTALLNGRFCAADGFYF